MQCQLLPIADATDPTDLRLKVQIIVTMPTWHSVRLESNVRGRNFSYTTYSC